MAVDPVFTGKIVFIPSEADVHRVPARIAESRSQARIQPCVLREIGWRNFARKKRFLLFNHEGTGNVRRIAGPVEYGHF